jgi:carbonic anhydrase/acetyltransferase-like protein (isoleucine patch superfamily)
VSGRGPVIVGLDDRTPRVHAGAWVAPTAVLAGAVTVSDGASVWFGAVVRADGDEVTLGEQANLQDGAVVHADPGLPVTVGARVSVGHGAVLHGCTVGEGTLVGMRATVLNGAVVGGRCLVAAGAVVLEGARFEDRSLIAGVPAKRRRELTDEEVRGIEQNADDYLALAARYRDATDR